MPLQFYNTLTRRLEEFVPIRPGHVGMYVCGPTVYAPPHIGNLRTFFFADILHRYLEYRNFQVKFVMNLTDVDDKTINGARREGVSLAEYTEPFVGLFFQDLDALGIQRADAYPRATAHVGGMVELIQRLMTTSTTSRMCVTSPCGRLPSPRMKRLVPPGTLPGGGGVLAGTSSARS
jgi:cysteinyl-tRNA synthetase